MLTLFLILPMFITGSRCQLVPYLLLADVTHMTSSCCGFGGHLVSLVFAALSRLRMVQLMLLEGGSVLEVLERSH
jgi:hypothetical protein